MGLAFEELRAEEAGNGGSDERQERNQERIFNGEQVHCLPLQIAPGIGIERSASSEEQNHQAQGQRRFGGGDHQDENHKRLAG